MKLTIDNYKNKLPHALISRSKKCVVRECDEIEKHKYQAYVDENDTSYDVTILLNDTGEVIHHECDCGGKAPFCQHKLTLFLYVLKKAGAKKPSRKSKKVDKLDLLVNEVDVSDLRKWIKELLIKNKDIELAFIQHFSDQQKALTPEDVKKLTLDAVKAVIKNKRKIEVGEAKKIVDLWTEVHLPVVENYYSEVTDVTLFRNFNALVESCEEVQMKIRSSSNRINKYIEKLLDKVVTALNALQHENDWQLSLSYYADLVHGNVSDLRIHYLRFIEKAIGLNATPKANALIDKLIKQYRKCDPRTLYYGNVYTETLFNIVLNNDLFKVYYKVFKPITYNNDYNIRLIDNLINAGHLQLADTYCREQIRGNSRDEYDIPYLQFLKQIYSLEGDEHRLAEVLSQLFSTTFDFDDYFFIYERMAPEEEKKKWRTKALSRAKKVGSYNLDAMRFSFKLMALEKKYDKMVDYISEGTSYSLISEYAERMILADKVGFLETIFHHGRGAYNLNEEEAMKAIPTLLSLLKKHYSESEIKRAMDQALKSGRFYGVNMLVVYIKDSEAL